MSHVVHCVFFQDHARNMDYDDSKIDDDLDKLLQHIKEEQQNSMVIIHYWLVAWRLKREVLVSKNLDLT